MSVINNPNWIRDVKFNLKEYLKIDQLFELEQFEDFSWDDIDMLIDEAVKFSKEVLHPINAEGDKVGARLIDGKVIMPDSYKDAWDKFVEAGWGGMPMNPEFGGGGMPMVAASAMAEFIQAANPSFTLFPGLSTGSGRLIESFGTEELKQKYVEKMYTNEWTGSMCLTEPQAGSDLGLVRTKAVKTGDSYKITGSKIFITCGDHNMVDNIVHLVLARTEGSPDGINGISLFVVPKFRVDDAGELGEFNDVDVIGIEEKMGLHASPTCALEFGSKGNCEGFLVGVENQGMKQMFQMMNEARMLVAMVSLAISSQGFDHAIMYAKDRIQGAKLDNPKGGSVEISKHEDVRRMLMHMKSTTEGLRAMNYKANLMADLEHAAKTEEEREDAKDLLGFLVPLCKSYASDRVWELTRDAIQVFGGYGFTKEYPVEQLARESKIQSIWEGTNYIQAMDLVGRKLPMKMGATAQKFVEDHMKFCKENEDGFLANEMGLLNKSAGLIGQTMMQFSSWFGNKEMSKVGFVATRFLDSMAEMTISKCLLEQALIANVSAKTASGVDKEFYETKVVTAKYFVTNILPLSFSRLQTVLKGDQGAVSIPESAF